MSLDILAIEDQIKVIFDAKNVAASDPVDLSASMTARVKKVVTLNPTRIPQQASWFPVVSVWSNRKTVEHKSISVNLRKGQRKGTVTVKIFAIVTTNIATDPTKDEADRDVKRLCENIEEILRDNDTLNGTVLTQRVTDVEYTSIPGEKTIMEAGVIELEVDVYY